MNKSDLYRLIDALPANRLPEVKVYLEGLERRSSMDAYLSSAPEDDEDLTPSELEAIRQGLEQAQRGDIVSRDDVRTFSGKSSKLSTY